MSGKNYEIKCNEMGMTVEGEIPMGDVAFLVEFAKAQGFERFLVNDDRLLFRKNCAEGTDRAAETLALNTGMPLEAAKGTVALMGSESERTERVMLQEVAAVQFETAIAAREVQRAKERGKSVVPQMMDSSYFAKLNDKIASSSPMPAETPAEVEVEAETPPDA